MGDSTGSGQVKRLMCVECRGFPRPLVWFIEDMAAMRRLGLKVHSVSKGATQRVCFTVIGTEAGVASLLKASRFFLERWLVKIEECEETESGSCCEGGG